MFANTLYEVPSPNGEGGQVVNHVYGYQGDDTIVAESAAAANSDKGDDYFYGGSGLDTVSYADAAQGVSVDLDTDEAWRSGVDPIHGPKDRLDSIENATGSAFGDTLDGGGGANVLNGGGRGGGGDFVAGWGGDDTLIGGDGDDWLYGGEDDDNLYGGSGYNHLFGGMGDDIIVIEGAGEAYGGNGEDIVSGGSQTDYISGGDQRDVLSGNGGNDELLGVGGDDDLFGGAGDDRLEGGEGDDLIDGQGGQDTAIYDTGGGVSLFLNNGGGAGFVTGALGEDTIYRVEHVTTGSGGDTVIGNDATNTIQTGGGGDYVYAMGGNDVVYGGAGDDGLFGYDGADTLLGEDGDDDLYGMNGVDILSGQGEDLLVGGAGADMLRGGADADTFRWNAGDYGQDTALDFQIGQDRVAFGDGFLANQPGIGEGYAGEVFAFLTGDPADSVLMANTADGWTSIARFENVTASELSDAIADGSLFGDAQVGPLGEGGPGGLESGVADNDPIPPSRPDRVVSGGAVGAADDLAPEERRASHQDENFDFASATGGADPLVIAAVNSARAGAKAVTEAPDEAAIGVVLGMNFGGAAAGRADHDAPVAFDFFGGDMFGDALF